MKMVIKRLLIGALILGSTVMAYRYYLNQARAENDRLLGIVQTNYSVISIPPGSTLVYQEMEVSRVCKTAGIKQLFFTDRTPGNVCESIFFPLKSVGWETYAGCRTLKYPSTRAPIDGDRPSYSFSLFDAGAPSNRFWVSVDAKPQGAWGPQFMLSRFGEREAIPLARKQGKTFFTVSLRYTEDHALFKEYCPENSSRCDCVDRSLFAWKFVGGREFLRSD